MTEPEPPAAVVAAVSREPALLDYAGDIATAAGCRAVGLPTFESAEVGSATVLLVGLDAVGDLLRSGLPRRSAAMLIGLDGQERELWRAAGELAAAGAVSLPSGSAWLVRWLHERVNLPRGHRCVVAPVFGATGGSGASTVAAALAVGAGAAGLAPLLIDADPGPAGVDLLLADEASADHWQRFAGIRGFLDPGALHGLPAAEGVAYLGWAGGSPAPEWQVALGSVVAAASHHHHLVVVDGGAVGEQLHQLPRSSRPLLVVPASSRGVMAANAALPLLQRAFDPPTLVVLRDLGGRSDPRGWLRQFENRALLLGLDPWLIDDEEHGRPPGTRSRSPLTRLVRQALAELAGHAEAA